jgi:hypothetical protein
MNGKDFYLKGGNLQNKKLTLRTFTYKYINGCDVCIIFGYGL